MSREKKSIDRQCLNLCGRNISAGNQWGSFGRTGKWFGFQHYSALNGKGGAPDFIAMGKGPGNGHPISGLLVRSELSTRAEASGFRYVQPHIDDPLV